MFTGVIQELGRVRAMRFPQDGGGSAVIEVTGPRVVRDAGIGDSIAVSGACLTVTERSGDGFAADISPETLRCTTLGELCEGDPVNLERALRADAHLEGHIVQGHVDGIASLRSRDPGERWDELRFSLPEAIAPYLARKGSITVDGVSLTVTEISEPGTAQDEAFFGVALIPATLEATTLGTLEPGARVNIETDVLARYAERLLAFRPISAAPATQDAERTA